MPQFDLSRRGFLTGLGSSLVAAPVVVRAASLMPVRGIVMDAGLLPFTRPNYVDITRKAFVPRIYVQLYSADDIWNMLNAAI